MPRLAAVWATHRRNLQLIRREATLVAQTVLLPVAILMLVAFIFGGGGGDRWPIAVVDESHSAASAELLAALERSESRITPYFDLHHLPRDEARRRVAEGRYHLALRIPADFETTRRVEAVTYNVNTDAMKNVRLRLDHVAVTELDTTSIRPEVAPARPHQPWRSAYIGGSAVLLALLLGSTLVAANLFVLDRERHTRSPMLLTPLGPALAGLGHLITAVVTAICASLLPLGLSYLLFNLETPPARLVLVYVALLPALVGFAGLGLVLGHLLGAFRTVQPVIVMAALITFFGTGGFVGTAMLHPVLQRVADLWPPSRLFTWANPVLHGFESFTPGQLATLLAAGMTGPLLAAWVYRRERRQPPLPATL